MAFNRRHSRGNGFGRGHRRAGGDYARGLGKGRCWRGRVGGGRGLLLAFAALPLDVVELVLNHPPEVGRSAAELRQGAAQGAGQLRKLLRAEDDEGDQQDDDPVGNSEQFYSLPCLARIETTGAKNRTACPMPYDILFDWR